MERQGRFPRGGFEQGYLSAGSIKLNNVSNEKDMVMKEYEVEGAPKVKTALDHYRGNLFGNYFENLANKKLFQGLCKMPAWQVYLALNIIVLICVVSIGVVLTLSYKKVCSFIPENIFF